MKTGIELIAEERQEQIEKHGRTVEKDVVENDLCELCRGAAALLLDHDSQSDWSYDDRCDKMPNKWNMEIFAKMAIKDYKERLVIAGALIAAEIDRLNTIDNTAHG